jgi:hypothetical protein
MNLILGEYRPPTPKALFRKAFRARMHRYSQGLILGATERGDPQSSPLATCLSLVSMPVLKVLPELPARGTALPRLALLMTWTLPPRHCQFTQARLLFRKQVTRESA